MAKKKVNNPHDTAVETSESVDAAVISQPEKDYFEIIGDKNRRFILPNGKLIDLRFGVPKDALVLYKSGKFKYLGLKKGAEVLFQELDNDVIEKLIVQAPRPGDVAVLQKAMK